MIRLIKKKAKSIVCSVLAAGDIDLQMNPAVFATETATQTDIKFQALMMIR